MVNSDQVLSLCQINYSVKHLSKSTNWLRFNISLSYLNFKFSTFFSFGLKLRDDFLLYCWIIVWTTSCLFSEPHPAQMLICVYVWRMLLTRLLVFFYINRVSKSSMFDTGVESCLLISSFSFIDFLTTDKFWKSGFVLSVRPTSLEWHDNIKLCWS